MTHARIPASVAAGSSAAAEVGIEALRRGGNAADAAASMVLAAAAAETVFTGLGGGGFATYYDASSGSTTCLDFFVAIPGLGGHVPDQHEAVMIDFGGQVVPYAVGPGTVAVPGVPAGIARLHGTWGRLPWYDVVTPAARLAETGTRFGSQQAKVLAMVAEAMLRGGGAEAFARNGVLLDADTKLHHPGLSHAFEVLRDEGADAFYTGRVAEAIVTAVGDAGVSAADLEAYAPVESTPREAALGACVVQARGTDLDDLLGVLGSMNLSGDDGETALSLVRALRADPRHCDTSSAAAADSDGNVCAVTTSLGLSSGVWLADYGIHLNSMLGEKELERGELVPGERMGSMMTPLVMLDDVGPCLVGGAAGGSRNPLRARPGARTRRTRGDACRRGNPSTPAQPRAWTRPPRARLPRRGRPGDRRRGEDRRLAGARGVLRGSRGDRPVRSRGGPPA